MTPEQLKASILQLAIQGKLVEQRPEECTAEDLYQQIQEEKAKLIKEGKIKKEKPLPPIEDDEIPFDIPESWKWVRISDCIQVNPSVKFNDESEVSFVPMTNIEAGYKSAINISEVKLWKDVKKNFSKFQNEDVIVAKITPCFQNRKSAIAKNLLNGYGAGTTELNILRSGSLIDNLYLLYFVKSPYFINYGKDKFTGTAGQQRFGGDSLKQTLFPLPPLAEQKRIVAKIEKLLPLVEKYQKPYSELELLNSKFSGDMKKSILQYAIQGKLVEQRPEDGTAEDLYQQIQEEKANLIKEGKLKKEKPLAPIADDEIPFDIPDSWMWVRFSSIIDVRDGTHDSPKYESQGIPLITSKNLSSGNLSFEKVNFISQEDAKKINERSLVENGDILFAMIGSIGNPVIVNKNCEFCIKNVALFKNIDSSLLQTKYVYYFLLIQQEILKKKAKGGVQSFVPLNMLRNILIPLPPLAVQKRIVAKIEELLALCDKLKLK